LQYPHKPVMVNETISILVTDPDGAYVDGTVGSGGHSEAIGRKLSPQGRLIGMDKDPEGLKIAKERLAFLGKRVTLINASYAEVAEILGELKISKISGVLLDLGLSSSQLELSGRGFSFNRDEPLDMRMDPGGNITAHNLINELSPQEIEKILRDYGEEKKARSISRAIDRERKKQPIESSLQLANLIRAVIPSPRHPGAIDPATRTFQALRIAVNNELENLKIFLEKIPTLMKSGGRLVILSYHSLEDRLVKKAIKDWEIKCSCPPDFPKCVCGKKPLFRRIYKKGIKPAEKEILDNPRSRSATLRSAERI
jgi:16S rRNA (cytosine1402-N4)-methyltransferase